jgi:hypothetical protein
MRDSLPPRFVGTPPRSKERQRRHKDPKVKRKEKKIDKARKLGYIVTKFVGITRSFMRFFLRAERRRQNSQCTTDCRAD